MASTAEHVMRIEPSNCRAEADVQASAGPVEPSPDWVADSDDMFETPRVRRAAVLFADIVDFTAMVEGMQPERVFTLLRSFHRRMSSVVHAHHGAIGNYLGDAVLAIFGTSPPNALNASNALLCAHAMLRELERWNEKGAGRGAARIDVGIGIHYGPVVSGNIGDAGRPEFAVVGDVVNVASRIERLTRRYDASLIVSEELVDAVRREGNSANELLDAFTEAELLKIRGRRNAITIRIYKNRRPLSGRSLTRGLV